MGKVGVLYITEPWYLSLALRVSGHIHHSVFTFTLYMNLVVLQAFCIVCGGTIVRFIICELNLQRKNYKSVASVRLPEKLILVHRSAQVFLQAYVLPVLGYLLVPAQAMITHMVMFACFLLTKHGDKVSQTMKSVVISWALLAAITWIAILELCGFIHSGGVGLLKSWKYHRWSCRKDKKLMSRFRKSCKPIMIHYGRTYGIRRITVLKFVRGLSKGIFRTLLTLGQ